MTIIFYFTDSSKECVYAVTCVRHSDARHQSEPERERRESNTYVCGSQIFFLRSNVLGARCSLLEHEHDITTFFFAEVKFEYR